MRAGVLENFLTKISEGKLVRYPRVSIFKISDLSIGLQPTKKS